MTSLKPQLAEDAQLDKVTYPCFVQPKLDGVRAMNLTGTLVGRSLDPFKGFGVTEYFSKPEFIGLDGEMILGNVPNSTERLCSLTTGAMGRFKGVTEMPDLHWFVFDYVTPETAHLGYGARYDKLAWQVGVLNHPRIHLVPRAFVGTRNLLDIIIADHSEQGFEGSIIRNPRSTYKPGRSTAEGQLWRVKPWGDFEILVTGITEGQKNENAAKTNTLGRTERSSAQAGMVPNGQVGSIQGTLVADVKDHLGHTMFAAGLEITAGSGEMSVKEATHFFNNPHELVGHYAKVKHMTFGYKDLPRFPTFMSIRLREDMASV